METITCCVCTGKPQFIKLSREKSIINALRKTKEQLCIELYGCARYCDSHNPKLLNEVWRDIHPNFNCPRYEISNLARIKNKVSGNFIMGYMRCGSMIAMIHLGESGTKSIQPKLQTLVAFSFLENPNNYCYIKHKDNDVINNKADNLEWVNSLINDNKINMDDIEIWKTINPSLGLSKYEISNWGQLRKIQFNNIIKGCIHPSGYLQYKLIYDDGKSRTMAAHRIVAYTFLENKDNLPYVDHIDLNRSNNKVSNLRWCSAQDNSLNKSNTRIILPSINKEKKEDSLAVNNQVTLQEEWKKIPLETKYDYHVSNKGHIKNVNTGYTSSGSMIGCYKKTALVMKDGSSKSIAVHRLVILAFIGPPPEDKELVNHIDENKINNCLENLEYVDHLSNMIHSSHKHCKPVEQYTKDMKFIQRYPSIIEADKITKVNETYIINACKGKCEFAGGFIWKYASDATKKINSIECPIHDVVEEWKKIPLETMSDYYVSNLGRVKNGDSGIPLIERDEQGYKTASLMMLDGKLQSFKIHKLVMLAFNGTPPEGKEVVNHIDENKENNCLNNLEYVSNGENILYSAHKYSKKIHQYTKDLVFIQSYVSIVEASRITGINKSAISKACNGHSKSSGGFIWKFDYNNTEDSSSHNRDLKEDS